jgi:hypothetical protein
LPVAQASRGQLPNQAANGITFNLGAGADTVNFNVTGVTANFTNAGGNKTLNVNGGSINIGNDIGAFAGIAAANVPVVATINVNAGQVTFGTTQHLAALNIASGALATMNASGSRVLVTKSLSLAGTGSLDLNDNDMILDYSGSPQIGFVQPLSTLPALATGRAQVSPAAAPRTTPSTTRRWGRWKQATTSRSRH